MKETLTDVVVNALNCPFITAIESKRPNTYYMENNDYLFYYSAGGFVMKDPKKFSKKYLIKNNLL